MGLEFAIRECSERIPNRKEEEVTGSVPLHEDTMVTHGFLEVVLCHERVELLVPLSRCLLQAVETLCQSAHQMLLAWNLKTFRLLHVDLLFKVTVEKCCLDVELFDLQVEASC